MKKIIHNTETNEIIEIELTEQEIADMEAARIAAQAEAVAKAAAKAELLDRLGITEDEAKLLLA